ncbi:hypothetical protein [Pseudomonas defluvii]|uniref:hypothetical protein n=1 Tax=Pseudomonas defluvii TaxID=1876757 RepID=UPI003906439F
MPTAHNANAPSAVLLYKLGTLLVLGNTGRLRGFDAGSGLTWAQTTTRHGRLHFFTGLSSDGSVWAGLARPFGWNVITRFSTSSGGQGRLSCNRLKGCD